MSGGNRAELVEQFIAITSADAAVANNLLEASGYDLERAVDLFFNAPEGHTGPAVLTDEELARQLASQPEPGPRGPSGIAAICGDMEEDVRAPIPAKVDRLYGDGFFFADSRRNLRPANQEVNAFRDFEAEGSRLAGRNSGKAPSRLGEMFEPPKGLQFEGGFEEAKEEAMNRKLWLLVNLQSNTEFASHQLNRDTWSDPTLQDIIKGSFLFLQMYHTAPEGERLQALYRLFDLPATVVIDPLTGSAMRVFTGFIPGERLMEELVPFMDHSPHDPEAQRLGNSQIKRKLSQAAKPDQAIKPAPVMTEDEELEMALRMSAAESAPAEPSPVQAAAESSAQPSEAAPPQAPQKAPEELQQEAAAALPPETDAQGPGGCRVAVRLPDGRRVQRLFRKAAPLSVLRTFCLASSAEAAAGRPFSLKEPRPGAVVLEDWERTLEEAGVANATVAMSWSD